MFILPTDIRKDDLGISKIMKISLPNLNDMNRKKFEGSGAQRAKFHEKVHKPPLRINVINFELNGFNASIWSLGFTQTPKNVMH